ncbi:MAG: ribbon-helix-helix domain-containing protein [Halanaerobiales bacterium]|nr:ribbon-helix-helix domain-containing protein [Halanaerobiales bacterium]
MERAQISLSEELREKVDKEAEEKGIGISEMIRYILFQYYDHKDDLNE